MTEHLEVLLSRIKEDPDPEWTLERIQALLGSEVPADTCHRLLRRLERMRVLVPKEDGTWVRASWPGGAQHDWYS